MEDNKDWGLQTFGDFVYSVGISIFTATIVLLGLQSKNKFHVSINFWLLISGLILILLRRGVEKGNIIAIIFSILFLFLVFIQIFYNIPYLYSFLS